MEESDSFKNIVGKIGAARKKTCVLCLGCPESQIDSARVQVFLKRNGCVITENLKEADLIFFRTCGFTKVLELEVLEAIRHIKSKMQRDAILIPWGCLPKINPNALNHNFITLSEEDVWKLNKLLAVKEPIEKVNANFLLPKYEKNGKIRRVIDFPRNLLWPFERNHPIVNTSKYGLPYFIKASTGCYGGCTYCAIRLSRGKTKSKRIEEVASEFNRGLKLGFKDFRLVGTDLGAYGRDRGCTLVDLLNIITEEEGKYVLSLRNVNPYWLIEMYNEMKPILSSGKIRYIASSVESGSNRILKIMGRRYTIEEYVPIIQTLNKNYPNILLGTQFMVGFPSESEQDHHQSEEVLKKALFDSIEVYRFSRRLGTLAAKMDLQIPENIKTSRYIRLLVMSLLNIFRRKFTRLYS